MFYFLPALRLLRVGSELWRVELAANPLDWSKDELNREYNFPLRSAPRVALSRECLLLRGSYRLTHAIRSALPPPCPMCTT